MLTIEQRAAALKIVMAADDPEDFPNMDERLCNKFPTIATVDLIALYREAGEKQLAEADELEAWTKSRFPD